MGWRLVRISSFADRAYVYVEPAFLAQVVKDLPDFRDVSLGRMSTSRGTEATIVRRWVGGRFVSSLHHRTGWIATCRRSDRYLSTLSEFGIFFA